VPNSPPTPLIKDGLPTPKGDSAQLKTADVSFADDAEESPSHNAEATQQATQQATQLASQYIQPPPDAKDVWGYLIPIDMDKEYGDLLTLKKRSSCDGDSDEKSEEPPKKGRKKPCQEKESKGSPGGYLIGRHAECDLKLKQPTVSNRHCVIFKVSFLLLLKPTNAEQYRKHWEVHQKRFWRISPRMEPL